MQWTDVFRVTAQRLRADLPADLRACHWKASGFMAKAWYGNPALHYEIWIRARQRVIELGLHFEADDLTNARLLAAFRARAREVMRALGADARIEEWDRGWSRVWEPVSLELPDGELLARVPARFLAYVRVLEPILREELPAEVRWTPPATGRRKVTSSRTSR